jgi:hypothetical protein
MGRCRTTFWVLEVTDQRLRRLLEQHDFSKLSLTMRIRKTNIYPVCCYFILSFDLISKKEGIWRPRFIWIFEKYISPSQCPRPYLCHTLYTYLRNLDFCPKGITQTENTELKRMFWRKRRPYDKGGERFTIRRGVFYPLQHTFSL